MPDLHSVRDLAYRVDVDHNPASGDRVCWTATVRPANDPDHKITDFWAASPEEALERAQRWIKAKNETPLPSETYYLTADGTLVNADPS